MMTQRTIILPGYFVTQIGDSFINESDNFWKNYIEKTYRDIPMILIKPFQSDASPFFAIKKKYANRLYNLSTRKHYRLQQCTRLRMKYACHENDIHTTGVEYITRTEAFKDLLVLTQQNSENMIYHFISQITTQIKQLLEKLYEQQKMTSFQYEQMFIRRYLTRLDYLLFLPVEPDRNGTLQFQHTIIST